MGVRIPPLVLVIDGMSDLTPEISFIMMSIYDCDSGDLTDQWELGSSVIVRVGARHRNPETNELTDINLSDAVGCRIQLYSVKYNEWDPNGWNAETESRQPLEFEPVDGPHEKFKYFKITPTEEDAFWLGEADENNVKRSIDFESAQPNPDYPTSTIVGHCMPLPVMFVRDAEGIHTIEPTYGPLKCLVLTTLEEEGPIEPEPIPVDPRETLQEEVENLTVEVGKLIETNEILTEKLQKTKDDFDQESSRLQDARRQILIHSADIYNLERKLHYYKTMSFWQKLKWLFGL